MNPCRERVLLGLVEAALALTPEERLDWLQERCSPGDLALACRFLHRADALAAGDELRLLSLVAAAARQHTGSG